MGMTPADVLALPLHDYQAAIHHYNKGSEGEDQEEAPLSSGDFDEMLVSLAASGMAH